MEYKKQNNTQIYHTINFLSLKYRFKPYQKNIITNYRDYKRIIRHEVQAKIQQVHM